MTLFLPAPIRRGVLLPPSPPAPQHPPPSLAQGPSQATHLRLKLVFQGLPGGPQVPAPQAGVQPPRPDVLVFDSNALGSIRGALQVPDHKGCAEGVRAETLSPSPRNTTYAITPR